jgi:hypothetical protein
MKFGLIYEYKDNKEQKKDLEKGKANIGSSFQSQLDLLNTLEVTNTSVEKAWKQYKYLLLENLGIIERKKEEKQEDSEELI